MANVTFVFSHHRLQNKRCINSNLITCYSPTNSFKFKSCKFMFTKLIQCLKNFKYADLQTGQNSIYAFNALHKLHFELSTNKQAMRYSFVFIVEYESGMHYIQVNIAEHFLYNDKGILHDNNDPCNCFQVATTTR